MPRKKFLNVRKKYTNKFSVADLINAESNLGRTIFGPIPDGHQREFFQSKKNVWIWHESFTNQIGKMEELTIRYEVRPSGVYKRANRGDYQKIEGAELNNFCMATRRYLDLVKTNLYC